jgi:hypothetical protein
VPKHGKMPKCKRTAMKGSNFCAKHAGKQESEVEKCNRVDVSEDSVVDESDSDISDVAKETCSHEDIFFGKLIKCVRSVHAKSDLCKTHLKDKELAAKREDLNDKYNKWPSIPHDDEVKAAINGFREYMNAGIEHKSTCSVCSRKWSTSPMEYENVSVAEMFIYVYVIFYNY